MIKRNWVILFLGLITIIALFLRIYKLDQVPPSVNWDEASVGYNSFAVWHWGKDEWGKTLPVTFKSFGDDKSPVHIYFTALSVGLLGLSEFSIRLPPALFGVINVVTIFYLGKLMFGSRVIGLIAALFLAISPFNIQFSRFNHEANFSLFFFMSGLVFFYKAIKQKPKLLPLSMLSFCISIISYHSPKVFLPIMIILLTVLYFKSLWKMKMYVSFSMIILILFALLFYLNPSLLGLARAAQTSIPQKIIYETQIYKQTGNEILGRIQISWQRYLTYFSNKYLFISGDPIPRHSTQIVGEFYKIDMVFLFFGIIFIFLKRNKQVLVLASWALFAPIPAAVTGHPTEISHAARALFQMGSWHLVAALGLYLIINFIKKPLMKFLVLFIAITILGYFFWIYLADYYNQYSKRSAIEWQYGMKEIVLYVHDHPEYDIVYITPARYQPYIFFLYYLKTPLPEFLSTAIPNNLESRSHNRISLYGKFIFEGWDPVEIMPYPNILYVLTPSEYDGLRRKSSFDVKKIVHYPPGEDAFFIVSAKK